MSDVPPTAPDETPPPFLGRWRNVYVAVLAVEAAVVGLLALLTVIASGGGR